jgi:hypothetical protein
MPRSDEDINSHTATSHEPHPAIAGALVVVMGGGLTAGIMAVNAIIAYLADRPTPHPEGYYYMFEATVVLGAVTALAGTALRFFDSPRVSGSKARLHEQSMSNMRIEGVSAPAA